jgi:hypothetical protein
MEMNTQLKTSPWRRSNAVTSGMLMLLVGAVMLSAQDISISGKVTDKDGKPLSGVIVKLMAALLQDTTAADGAYQLKGPGGSAVRDAQNSRFVNSLYYRNQAFVLNTAEASAASLRLFDLRGKLLATVFSGQLRQGTTEVRFPLEKFGHEVLLLHVKNARQTFTCKLTKTGMGVYSVTRTSSAGGSALGKAAALDWLQASKQGYATHSQQVTTYQATINITLNAATAPDLGPNVFIFEQSMSSQTMQGQINTAFGEQEYAQFGSKRYAFLLKPGEYDLDINVGFYTQVAGLGLSPDSVIVNGAVRSEADWMGGNATCTFWRSAEGVCVVPSVNNTNRWAVSQAAPYRRMHIKGNLVLDDGGWSSGGFLADSKIDGNINSGSQQQWFNRNDDYGSWSGGGWNMVHVGITKPPAENWPSQPHTVIPKTPLIREKPFLIFQNGVFAVLVPELRTDSTKGVSWTSGKVPGTTVGLDQFYIARADRDNASAINAALSQGKNLLLTPGLYHLTESIKVTRPGTIVMGLGLPSLIPDNGTAALEIADVPGVKVVGILVEATAKSSPTLVKVGDAGSTRDNRTDPICIYDVFCRTGGAFNGLATSLMTINSNNVIADHLWLWRADHGTGASWYSNINPNGLIVNGNNVTIYGLFVEHCQAYQTIWNGNGGRVYFYQNELPYDAASQAEWSHDGVNGYAAYKVADNVTTHEAWGMGAYGVFTRSSTKCFNAYEVPTVPGVKMHRLNTLWLNGQGGTEITHVINGTGDAVNSSHFRSTIDTYN